MSIATPSDAHRQLAADLHRRVPVADGHADALMWNRDLNVRADEGHVDFPRLRDAGVKIQCFTVVTRGFPVVGGFPVFAAWRGWAKEAFRGPWSRAVWQIDRMHAYCAASSGQVAIADSRRSLEANLAAGRLSAILGIEGGHAIEGKAERVHELYRRGVRFMGLTHLSNNALGGTSFPIFPSRRLTAHGGEVLDAMASVGMSVDVAHTSEATLEDVLSHSSARPFCSHTGVRGAGGGWRNLSDEALKRIAEKGGVVGIIFATVYLGGDRLEDVVRHMQHAVKVMGEDAVGLGSDYDGFVPLPKGMRDVSDLPRLTETMLAAGMPERLVEKILGENFRRFFAETLGAD